MRQEKNMKIAAFATLVLSLSLLAACGGDGGTQDAIGGDSMGCVENDQKACTTTEGYSGVQVCQGGQWTVCQAACADGTEGPCTTACNSKGTKLCANGEWGSCEPPAEECNNKDDDCDGQTDEDLGQDTCGMGECAHSADECKAGVMQNCNPFEGAGPEICDGKDNDCNGMTDENLLQECTTACGKGIEKCVDGQWKDCSAPAPQQEICDNVDNDCNGQTDDGVSCDCTPPDSKTCGIEEGECYPGTQICDGGTWGPCGGDSYVGPMDETCNNKDDDCDGETDEGLVQDCQTACGDGKEVCKEGAWKDCTAPEPTDEVCDGLDNDCNDQVDEGLDADQWEGNETCATVRDLGDAKESEGAVEFGPSLYPAGDVDWFSVTAKEGSKLLPCGFSLDQCHIVTVQVTGIPEGVDYDLEVFGGDCEGGEGIFESKETGATPESVVLGWYGTYGLSDDLKMFLNIFEKDGKGACQPYKLVVDYWSECPGDNDLCPWE